jgi:peptidoglycan/LPS O-acetylase OafA/YrhL
MSSAQTICPIPQSHQSQHDSKPARDPNSFTANMSKREIPSLYGLRGVAALAVVFFHYLLDTWKWMRLFPGPYAVTLFFELSGLLITWLLLQEINEFGRLDKKQFYLRRALRLFPVFYVVWGLCRLAGPFAGSWATFFYMGDYYHALTQHYNILTVAWSLGVEEKFYLLWPFLLASVERTRLIKILFAVLIFEPLYRFVLSALGHEAYTWFAFDTRLDAIVLGCLIALFAERGRIAQDRVAQDRVAQDRVVHDGGAKDGIALRWVAPRWVAPRWIGHSLTSICALLCIFVFQNLTTLVTYLLAVILISAVARPSVILNNPVARYLGAISYSLYLCHSYARDILWPRIFGDVRFHNLALTNNPALTFVSQLALALLLASLLHFAVERPFLKLKNSFHKKPQPL